MDLRWAATATMLTFACTAALGAKIVVEAENYAGIASSMVKKTDKKASGGKYISIPLRRPHGEEETGPSDTGHARYKVRIPRAGTYQFWARCRWYDACGNSFFILVDTTKVTSKTPYVTDQTFGKYHWVAGPKLKLTKGVHTIRVQNREDGTRMDQWLLTTTSKKRWEPTRIQKQTAQYIIRPQ